MPECGSQPGTAPLASDEFPGIDRITGLRRVTGNQALYRKLLLDFRRDFADAAAQIRLALAEGRPTAAERQAHTLKGVAGNIGAMELHRAAQELDSALRGSDLEKGEALLSDVERELAKVIRGLEPLAQGASPARGQAHASVPAAGIAVDRSALEASLRELADLVRKSNPDAENALEQVRGALKGSRGPEVEGIARALDLFDFRGAAKALADLAEVEGIPLGAGGP